MRKTVCNGLFVNVDPVEAQNFLGKMSAHVIFSAGLLLSIYHCFLPWKNGTCFLSDAGRKAGAKSQAGNIESTHAGRSGSARGREEGT